MNAPHKPTQLDIYRGELLPPAKADELYAAMPAHIKPAVFERNLLNALMANPDLMKFPAALVYREVAKAAGLGLLLDPLLGEAYLVTAYNYKSKQTEPQLRVGYKGMCKLARHTGEVGNIYAHEIHERDYVEADLGFPKVFHHKPKLFTDRGEIIGYVALIAFKDGTFDFEPMSVEQCHAIRDRSDAWKAFRDNKIKSTPWSTDDSEMSKKTVLRRLLKRQAQSPELVAAQRIEDEADFPDMQRSQVPAAPRDAGPPRVTSAPKVIEQQPLPHDATTEQIQAENEALANEENAPESQASNIPVPHELVPEPGKTNSFEGWATAYIALIETSPDKGTLLRWADVNLKRLETLKKSPEWTGKVTKATKAIYAQLEKAAETASEPQGLPLDDMGGDAPQTDAKKPRGRPRGSGKAPEFGKDYDGWFRHQLTSIAAVETPEALEAIFELYDPIWSDIMPPDREALQGARREAERRLEQ